MPRTKPKHEYITVLSDGFRYRARVFPTINQVFKWFKEHFRDPPPRKLRTRAAASRGEFTIFLCAVSEHTHGRTPAGATSASDRAARLGVNALQNAMQSLHTPQVIGDFDGVQ